MAVHRLAGPAYISNSAANILSPTSGQRKIVKHIRVTNITSGAVTFSLFVGATGGSTDGTNIADERSVAAHADDDIYFSPGLALSDTDYLSGLASAASSLVITVMGEAVIP